VPDFSFVARDRGGRRVSGVRDALSDGALIAQLRSEGLLTLSVARRDTGGGPAGERTPWFKPGSRAIEITIRQLAFLLKSGVTLLSALEIAAAQSDHGGIAKALRAVAREIRAGSNLTEAMRRRRIFDELTCALVEVGESGGQLDTVLLRAAEVLERRRMLRTQTVTALIYPALVLVMAVATVAYMMVGVIPKLAQFLASLNRALPPSTQFLIDASRFLRDHFLDGVVLAAVLGATVYAASLTRLGREWFDAALVRIPVVGVILRWVAASGFSYTLALLLRSGVRITRALEVVVPILPLPRFKNRVDAARAAVERGSGLSESLRGAGAFDPLVTGMVAVGESSGQLDEVLEHMAEYHDERLRELVRRLGVIVEPVILVFVGVVVGFVYLSFFSAVYSFAGRR
jgi:type II secretory pathway component PulF